MKPRRWISRIALVGSGLVAAMLAAAVAVSMFGRVDGEEFAPDTFERRCYSYYVLPLVDIKLTPTKRAIDRPDLTKMLVEDDFISIKDPPTRWDFVVARRNTMPWREGDARILTRYFASDADKKSAGVYWQSWTKRHPKLAELFWPAVVRLARENRYWQIPEAFYLAEHASSAAQFGNDLEDLLQQRRQPLTEGR